MITYAVISEKGSRPINEDSLAARMTVDSWCFALADGLGGHGRGEIASQIVVQKAVTYHESNGTDADFISKAFELGQEELLKAQKKEHTFSGMKTTLVLCSINQGILRWGHIGDSRLYIFNGYRIKRRTLDHSVPQMLALAHDIKEKDIRFHPDRNGLLKVMGIPWSKPEYDLGENVDINSKSSLLICSDGFWELIDERMMLKCLRKALTVQEWLGYMTDIVEKNGCDRNMDNYSAICVWCR